MLSLCRPWTYFGLEIWLHSFVVSKLDWDMWSASCSGHFKIWRKIQAVVGMRTEWIPKIIWILCRRKFFFQPGNRSPNLRSSLPISVSNRLTPKKQTVILTSRQFWEQNTSKISQVFGIEFSYRSVSEFSLEFNFSAVQIWIIGQVGGGEGKK